MEAKKDIGKAVREKLDALDRQPGNALWDSINTELDKKKKRKFPFFFIYACAFLAAVTAAYFLLADTTATPFKDNTIYNNSTNQTGDKNNAMGNSSSAGARSDKAAEASQNTENNNLTDKNSSPKENTINRSGTTGKHIAIPGKSSSAKNKNNAGHKNNTLTNATTAPNNNQDSATGSPATTIRNKTSRKTNSKTGKYAHAHTAVVSSGKPAKQSRRTKIRLTTNTIAATSGSNKSNTGDLKSSNSYNKQSNAAGAATDAGRNTAASTSENADVAGTTSTFNTKTTTKETDSNIQTRDGIGTINTESILDTTLVVKDSLKATVAEQKEEEKKDGRKKDSLPPIVFKKFSVFAFAGPSLFSFPNRTIVTDSTTSNISTSNTLRFGALFGYRINHKLSIRTGFSFFNLKQTAKNIKLNYIMVSTGTEIGLVPPDDFTWIDYKFPFGTNSGLIISTLASHSVNLHEAIINIDRELSYVEVPLEVSYNLFDKRFGLTVIGGGSMLLQNKNKVTAYNENGQMYLGKWNAAAKTSFTGTLGLGLNYKISPSLQINAEPVFNYYFNTYNDSKPYSFTIRVGLQYNFDF